MSQSAGLQCRLRTSHAAHFWARFRRERAETPSLAVRRGRHYRAGEHFYRSPHWCRVAAGVGLFGQLLAHWLNVKRDRSYQKRERVSHVIEQAALALYPTRYGTGS
jgi:hypothetical protein